MTVETESVGAGVGDLHGELVEKVSEAAERLHVPGVAVGILAGDVEDYVFHGVTSIENPLEVDARTLFQIGSTTKTYTATAMMVLVDRGLVDLDAAVRTYLPSLRLQDESVAERVTVRHLLNHTAGWTGDFREDTGDGDDALERFVARLVDAQQQSPLGAVASYNNSAVNLAGRVIEVVTQSTYEQAIRDHVLEPIGLEESWFFARDVISRRFAVGHREQDGELRVARPWGLPRAAHSSGGVVSTAADQIRYARFHLGDGTGRDGERVLRPETLALMREPTAPLGGGALGDWVGISWLMRDVDGVRIVGHGGTTNGQLSSFDLVPTRAFAVTVLTNSTSGGLLHDEISSWVLEAYCGIVEPEPTPLQLGAAELAEYAARYASPTAYIDVGVADDHLELDVTYTEAGEKLLLTVLGEVPPKQPPVPIKMLSDTVFVVVDGEARGMKGTVLRDPDGSIRAMNVGGRLAYRS